jgi:hypothetical protein
MRGCVVYQANQNSHNVDKIVANANGNSDLEFCVAGISGLLASEYGGY